MSLNSVVNNLVRAAAGISTEISDADLDQHVAKLLADEAKAREVKWSELGLGAFLGGDRGSGRDSPDPSQPKPNKRFLASVIRTVDGHNSALLRAQAEAARSARQERGDDVTSSSGSSRRGGAGRLFGGAMKGLFSDRFEPEKGGSRDRDRERSSRGSRDGGRERDSERDWRRARGREGDYDYERDRERRREERLERDKSFAERRSRGWGEEDEEQYYNEGAEGSSYRPEPTGADNNDIGINDDGSGDDDARISKMDKYFQSSYDPRLDLGAVPKEGLVAEVGWDNMLAILKERGKKKRHQSPTLSDEAYGVPQGITLRSPSPSTEVLLSRKIDRTEKKRRKEERKRRTAGDWSDASEQERDREKRRRKKGEEKARDKALDPASGFTRKEEGMMEVEYVKKGGVREWDKGK